LEKESAATSPQAGKGGRYDARRRRTDR
jgi:hypothetical protein